MDRTTETLNPCIIETMNQCTHETLTKEFFDLSSRFEGVDLQCRRSAWLFKYRARIITNKNERAEYRVTAYGNTPEIVMENIIVIVRGIDALQKATRPCRKFH